jgi:hypothetical protein
MFAKNISLFLQKQTEVSSTQHGVVVSKTNAVGKITLNTYLNNIDTNTHCLSICFLFTIGRLTTDFTCIRALQAFHEDFKEETTIPSLFLNKFSVSEYDPRKLEDESSFHLTKFISDIPFTEQTIIISCTDQMGKQKKHSFSIGQIQIKKESYLCFLDPADLRVNQEKITVNNVIKKINSKDHLIKLLTQKTDRIKKAHTITTINSLFFNKSNRLHL